jgi:hypothetical protein
MSEPSDAFKRRVDAELAPIRNHLDELRAELDAAPGRDVQPYELETTPIPSIFYRDRPTYPVPPEEPAL